MLISLVEVHVNGLVDSFLEYFIAHRELLETRVGELLSVIHKSMRWFAHILFFYFR